MSLETSIREAGHVRIVEVRGKLVLGEAADRLHSDLKFLIERGWLRILVDLRGVEMIDSAGISTLLRCCLSLTRANGAMRLVCPAGRVRDTLKITRVPESIPTFDDEAQALASFDLPVEEMLRGV